MSSGVKTYKCEFVRWEYDTVFLKTSSGAERPRNEARSVSKGTIKYQAPDKGLFQVTATENYVGTADAKFEKGSPDQLEHWVCDGKSIFQVDHKAKTLTERPLPKEMQGTAISDGPLPFVFGAKAEKLKQRYWMREVTPPTDKDNIWLQAYPRYMADRENFRFAEIIISKKDFMPVAIQLYSPEFNPQQGNENRTVYQFSGTAVNGRFDDVFTPFVSPKVPWGYKKIVVQPGAAGASAAQPASRGDERAALAPRKAMTR